MANKITKCCICGKKIHITNERFEDEENEVETSDEGVCTLTNFVGDKKKYEYDTYQWFCNSCHKELMNGIKVDAVKILHELD